MPPTIRMPYRCQDCRKCLLETEEPLRQVVYKVCERCGRMNRLKPA